MTFIELVDRGIQTSEPYDELVGRIHEACKNNDHFIKIKARNHLKFPGDTDMLLNVHAIQVIIKQEPNNEI